MIDVFIIYDNQKDLDKLRNSILNNIFIHSYNMNKRSDRSAGFKLKNEWASKNNPFIIIQNNGKTIKCFYSEESYEKDNDIITQTINFINNESKSI